MLSLTTNPHSVCLPFLSEGLLYLFFDRVFHFVDQVSVTVFYILFDLRDPPGGLRTVILTFSDHLLLFCYQLGNVLFTFSTPHDRLFTFPLLSGPFSLRFL